MPTSTTTAQDHAVDAFLECVARCLAKRWLKIQRRSSRGEHLTDQLNPASEEQPLHSPDNDGERRDSR